MDRHRGKVKARRELHRAIYPLLQRRVSSVIVRVSHRSAQQITQDVFHDLLLRIGTVDTISVDLQGERLHWHHLTGSLLVVFLFNTPF